MELISLILSITILIILLLTGLFFRGYIPSYLAEKAKNLASKEDLAHITGIVEGIKALNATELEHVKAELLSGEQVTERRRLVYEEMCAALKVFIAGHIDTSEAKERFHEAYAAAWLWASDDVLDALNHFLNLQVQQGAGQILIEQNGSHNAYTAIILAMRKDVGFSGTTAKAVDYQFVYFG